MKGGSPLPSLYIWIGRPQKTVFHQVELMLDPDHRDPLSVFVSLLSDLGHEWWRQGLRPFKPGCD